MRKQTWLTMLCLLTTAFLVVAGCGGDDDDDDNVTGSNGNGSLTAVIDGVSFSASWFASAARVETTGYPTIVTLGGLGPHNGDSCIFGIVLQDPSEGTFSMGSGIVEQIGGLTFPETEMDYITTTYPAHGSITVSSYTAGRISGVFNFVAYTNDAQDSVVVTDGAFNLPVLSE